MYTTQCCSTTRDVITTACLYIASIGFTSPQASGAVLLYHLTKQYSLLLRVMLLWQLRWLLPCQLNCKAFGIMYLKFAEIPFLLCLLHLLYELIDSCKRRHTTRNFCFQGGCGEILMSQQLMVIPTLLTDKVNICSPGSVITIQSCKPEQRGWG